MQEKLSAVQFTRAEHRAPLPKSFKQHLHFVSMGSRIYNIPYGAHSRHCIASIPAII